jgi:hypothetical protein
MRKNLGASSMACTTQAGADASPRGKKRGRTFGILPFDFSCFFQIRLPVTPKKRRKFTTSHCRF